MKQKLKSLFYQFIDKGPTVFFAASAIYAAFKIGEDYGDHNAIGKLEHTKASSLTDKFTIKACPQLRQKELSIGILKTEENIRGCTR
jgi:hypothetical protein